MNPTEGINWGQTVDQVLVPLIVAAIGYAIHFALDRIAKEFQTRTGIVVKQAAIDRVAQELTTYAGMFIAHGEPEVMNLRVTTGSAGIDDLANKVLNAIPGELQQAGITPDRVPDLIVGAIGKLQAVSTPQAVQPVAPVIITTEGKSK